MPTITGTIKTATNTAAPGCTVLFTPKDTPKADSSSVINSSTISVITDSSGAMPSTTLISGKYTVAIKSGVTDLGSFDIDVPTGSGTHNINTIIDESGVESDTSSFVRRLYQGTSGVTISNTSATSILGTGVGSASLAANFLTDGKRLEIEGEGTITTTGTPGTLTLRLQLTLTAITLAITLPASLTAKRIWIKGVVLCREAGETADFITMLCARIGGASDTVTEYFEAPTALETDTSSALVAGLTAQFSATGQSLTIDAAQIIALP